MSVTDPTIKTLKGFVRKFTEDGADITDDNEDLVPFCLCLEKCFQKGMSICLSTFAIANFPEAWQWMEEIARRRDDSLISYKSIVENVVENQKVQEATGRFRLLIRTCLNRKCLHIPVGYLVRTPFLALDYYSTDSSILGDEILGEILYSVLLQISKLNFRLNLRNASFLDDTWELPKCVSVEFVPCKTLGISVSFTRGKTLIIKIEKNSVVSEDGRIEVGDVLDEINGHVLTQQTRGNLRKMLNKNACLPISAHIVKCRTKKSDEMFAPIVNVIKNSGLDHMKKLLRPTKLDSTESESSQSKSPAKNGSVLKVVKPGFLTSYCGSIAIGTLGDVKQIEGAMRKLLKPDNIKNIPVRFECLELGIKVTQESNGEEIMKKSYMEISSCGKSGYFPHHFAFISGETNCSVATTFEAHVFYHTNENESQTILQSLGQGFYRTHFAV